MSNIRCNRLSPALPNLRCSRAEHGDEEECMYTSAAILQGSAAMLLDPDTICDDATRRRIEEIRESADLKPVHVALLEDVVSGDMKYDGVTMKPVQ